MKALVTGGAGFIGSHLVDALLERGDAVAVVDDLSSGRRERVPDGVPCTSPTSPTIGPVAEAERPDVVFHLAAQVDVRKSVADPAFDARVNVAGTAAVLEAARVSGARRVLLASTGGALYGEDVPLPTPEDSPLAPFSPYGASKAAAETYLALYTRLFGLSTMALRFGNVYGPRQDPHGEAGVIAIFAGAAVEGRTVTIYGDGTQTRDYVYVGDVVAGFLAAADSDATGAVNIGTGVETAVLDLVTAIGCPPSTSRRARARWPAPASTSSAPTTCSTGAPRSRSARASSGRSPRCGSGIHPAGGCRRRPRAGGIGRTPRQRQEGTPCCRSPTPHSDPGRTPTPWGMLAAIDLHGCPSAPLADPNTIGAFVTAVIEAIGMRAHGPLRLERFGEGDLQGWSAMQFIETSSITVHADEVSGRCFVDVFSCMAFDAALAAAVAVDHFGGSAGYRVLDR